MKTLKNVFSLFLLAIVFLACEPDDGPVTPVDNNRQYLEATLTVWRTSGIAVGPTSTISALNLSFRGEGESNILSSIEIESSHTELYGNNPASFDIENGEFRLISVSGEELFGVYSGFGSNLDGQVVAKETCQIMGGTGRYVNASGNLYVEIRSQKLSTRFPGQSHSMKAIIYGNIFMDQSQPELAQ